MIKVGTTIQHRFHADSLPLWARKHPEVIAVCKRDLAFRCNVHTATTNQWRDVLIRDAKRREVEMKN